MSARAHFKVAGIPVRVEPVFFVIAALFGLRYADVSWWLVFAWIAVGEQRHRPAAILLGAADMLRKDIGTPISSFLMLIDHPAGPLTGYP